MMETDKARGEAALEILFFFLPPVDLKSIIKLIYTHLQGFQM